MDPSNADASRLPNKGDAAKTDIWAKVDNIDNDDPSDVSVAVVVDTSLSLSKPETSTAGEQVSPVNDSEIDRSIRNIKSEDLENDSGSRSSPEEVKTTADKLYSNNDNGPVFPARTNRDIIKTSSPSEMSEDDKLISSTPQQDKDKDVLKTKDAVVPDDIQKIRFHYDANGEEDNENEKKTEERTSNLTSTSGTLFKASTSSSNNTTTTTANTENESLAPLNASFFNCQYQTPSWIDDPLIGVPPCAMENKNTHRKTGADMRILTAYMRSLNEMRLPEAIPPNELDKYLSSFFLVVRKADGSEYEPCSLRAMLASIERYLRFKNYPLSLTRDSAFSNMRNVLKLKQQTLRSIGKGQKVTNEVSPSSLAREGKVAHLFKSQEMGPYTPSSVVFTLCFYFCVYLRIRKSTENKKLLWGDIVLCKDDSGREFLTFSSQMLRRTQGSSKLNLRQRSYRVWADPSCPEKDPVTIYKFYAQKRPVSMNTNFAPFYLGINVLYPTQGQLWYRPAAMGINKLNEMVRQIRDITGIRSTSDFHGDIQITDKGSEQEGTTFNDDQSPSNESGDRQDSESDVVKGEPMEEGEDDDVSSNLAVDFSLDQHEPHSEYRKTIEATAGLQHPSMAVLATAAGATYSDGESNDSFSHHSLPVNSNGIGSRKDGDQEVDLRKSSSPDSPLNCSTKGRNNHSSFEDGTSGNTGPALPDLLSLDEAKGQLLGMVRRMELPDIMQFEAWLRAVKFAADPYSGQIVCKEDESSSRSGASRMGANIILNIALSPEALQGEGGPVTVTAQTSIPPSDQQTSSTPISSSSSSKLYSQFGRQPSGQALSKSLASSLSSKPSVSSSSATSLTSSDKPLDLATSPVHRSSAKSSLPSSSSPSHQGRSNRSQGSNGLFPAAHTKSGSPQRDSPLAKRLRLSTEQAEAYTSASIMASLSSASLVNEQLRLQLMQAGLRMGDYGDPQAIGNEAIRSQLLQHYGIKSEPK